MLLNILKITISFLLVLLISCDNKSISTNKSTSTNEPENKPVSTNKPERIIFQSLDLNDPKTFGAAQAFLGKKPLGFNDELKNTVLGLNENIYQEVSICGDGNCWIRSVAHAIIHQMFLNEDIYNKIIDKIKDIGNYYEKHRSDERYIYISPESINFADKLFHKLKSIDEEKRIDLYNKSLIDQYIIMLFRTVYAVVIEEHFPEASNNISKILSWQSSGDTGDCAIRLQYFLAIRLWSVVADHGFRINKVGNFGVLPNLESTQLIIEVGKGHSQLLRRVRLNDRNKQIERRSDFFPIENLLFYNDCRFYQYIFEDDPEITETRYSKVTYFSKQGTFLHAFQSLRKAFLICQSSLQAMRSDVTRYWIIFRK
jgi:hypothetical protein